MEAGGKLNVVITGAAGYVAGRMLPQLRLRYELTLLDVRTVDREGHPVDGVIEVDLLQRNRDEYREYFRDADAVIHCGFVHDRGGEGGYWGEVDNINMAYNVYKTCVEEEIKRAVVVSSNHAADYYERLIWSDRMETVTPDMYPLSDNFYGWAKASYELLGFVFASGGGGDRCLEVVQLRVGAPRETDFDDVSHGDGKKLHRALGAYLSIPDQVQLVTKSIETEDITDENGIPFQIFYGISGNTHRFWSLANAHRVINYRPQDDSQVRFADRLAEFLAMNKPA